MGTDVNRTLQDLQDSMNSPGFPGQEVKRGGPEGDFGDKLSASKGKVHLHGDSEHSGKEEKLYVSPENERNSKTATSEGIENTLAAAGRTSLHTAAKNCNEAIVHLLLSQENIDVNSKDKNGRTSLHTAAKNCNEAIVHLLLSQENIDVNSKDNNGRTPLQIAAKNGNEAIVHLLLSQENIDVNSKDNNGRTSLQIAAQNSNEAIVRLLLSQENIDVNSKDNDGWTSLHMAAKNGNEAIGCLLLSQENIDINSGDSVGRTPLSIAVSHRNEAILRMLLARTDLGVIAEIDCRRIVSTLHLRPKYFYEWAWEIPAVFQHLPRGKSIEDVLVITDHTEGHYCAMSSGKFLRTTWGSAVTTLVLEVVERVRCEMLLHEEEIRRKIPRKMGFERERFLRRMELLNEIRPTEFWVGQNGIFLYVEAFPRRVLVEISAMEGHDEDLEHLVLALSWVFAAVRPANDGILLAKFHPDTPLHASNNIEFNSDHDKDKKYLNLSRYLKMSPFVQEGQSYCWANMIHGATIVRNLHAKADPVPPGLRLDFSTLVSLAAVHSEVCYDDGIILVGFQTALIPLIPYPNQPEGSTRWHFVCSKDGKQISYDVADTFGEERLKIVDSKELCGIAFVGWCAQASMVLGSNLTSPYAERSNAQPVKSSSKATAKVPWTKKIRELHLNFDIVPLFSAGLSINRNNPPSPGLPTRAIFSQKRDHTMILNQAKSLYHIIYDDSTGSEQAWLVPAINLLLYCVGIYLRQFGFEGDYPRYFISSAATDENDAQRAQAALVPDTKFTSAGGIIKLHMLVAHLWMRIVEGNKLYFAHVEQFRGDKYIYGFELIDVAQERDILPKRLDPQPAMKAWLKLTKPHIPVIFCNGIGPLIKPKEEKDPKECGVHPSSIPPGILTCINSDLKAAFNIPKRNWDECWGEDGKTRIKIFDDLEWEVKGFPFDFCEHSGIPANMTRSIASANVNINAIKRPGSRTCWSHERLQRIQENLKQKEVANNSTENRKLMEIPMEGAVRFGIVPRK